MVPNVSVIGSVADSGFNPKWISGLQLWFDAADSNTLFSNSTGSTLATPSGSVGRWEDKGPNLWHATQSVAANQPIRITGSLFNGLDTLRFDGVNDNLRISQSLNIATNISESTFFVVATSEVKGTAGDLFFINNGSGNTPRIVLRTGGSGVIRPLFRRLDGDANYPYATVNISTTGSNMLNCYSVGVKFNPSSSYYYANGSFLIFSGSLPSSWTGSTSNTTSSFVSIGSQGGTGNYLQGNMGEIIYYNKYLNDIERRAIERYLLRKWNIRSYDQKTSSSIDIFTNVELYLDANNSISNPGSGTTWNDLSGNNRNATLTNGASFAISESINYVDCDGTNEYIDCGNILNYTSENFSLSCWARITTGNSSTFNTILLTNAQSSGQGYLLYVSSDNTAINNQPVFITYQASTNQLNTTNAPALLGNRWVFYSLVREGNIVRIYMNGVYAQLTTTNIINPVTSTGVLTAGAFTGGNQASLVKIGMIIAHSKSLSNQEVLELYNFTKTKYNIID